MDKKILYLVIPLILIITPLCSSLENLDVIINNNTYNIRLVEFNNVSVYDSALIYINNISKNIFQSQEIEINSLKIKAEKIDAERSFIDLIIIAQTKLNKVESKLNFKVGEKSYFIELKEIIDGNPLDNAIIDVDGNSSKFYQSQKISFQDIKITSGKISYINSEADITAETKARLEKNIITSNEISNISNQTNFSNEEKKEVNSNNIIFLIISILIIFLITYFLFFKKSKFKKSKKSKKK